MSTAVITRMHSAHSVVSSRAATDEQPLIRRTLIRKTRMRTTQLRTTPLRTTRLRITRRGQLVLTVAVALPVVCVAVGFALNGGQAMATDSTVSHSFQHVTVEAGESLWQLAGQIAPHVDPRVVVADIAQLNQLDSATVQPGQSIAIPQQYEK